MTREKEENISVYSRLQHLRAGGRREGELERGKKEFFVPMQLAACFDLMGRAREWVTEL